MLMHIVRIPTITMARSAPCVLTLGRESRDTWAVSRKEVRSNACRLISEDRMSYMVMSIREKK